MKLSFIKIIALSFITFFVSFNISAKIFESNYKIEIGGINIGTVYWSISKDNIKYKTLIKLSDKGLLSGLFKFSGNYSSEGKIIEGKFISLKYYQLWKTKKKKKQVEILFKNQMVSELFLTPEENLPPKVNFLNTKNVTDPLSSFINILTNSNNNFKTLDGRRIYKMIVESKNKKSNKIVKKIIITEYINIWADHKRNDLDSIEVEQAFPLDNNVFPNKIKIKHKGLVFKLTRI